MLLEAGILRSVGRVHQDFFDLPIQIQSELVQVSVLLFVGYHAHWYLQSAYPRKLHRLHVMHVYRRNLAAR